MKVGLEMLRVIKANQTIPRCMFAELVDDYGDSVYKFCRSLTYSKEDADDLFQETFLRVLEQLPKVDNSENPKGFLFSSALYIWKGWKRRYARRKRLAPTEPFDEAAAGGESMEEDFLVREEAHIVRELVESLPDKFKVPVILYYTVEMSVPDIALSMKIPPGTVKSRLFKARKLIEKGLKEHEE